MQLGVEDSRRAEIVSGLGESDLIITGRRTGPERRRQSQTQADESIAEAANMSRFAIRTPYFIVVACLIVAILGAVSLSQ